MDGSQAAAVAPDGARALAALEEARERTLALVAPLRDEDLERVHSTLMSPLVWDLGHIAAFEDLWIVHRHAGRPLLREELAEVYDAFETPRARRGGLPFLRSGEAREYLAEVRERSREVITELGTGDGVIAELVLRHEHQHNETMLQTIQLAQLEGVATENAADAAASPNGAGRAHTGLEMVEVPGGECTIGAGGWGESGFAYDNERPRHRTDVRAYLIGRTPISNATYLTFVEGGGYERREWWSDEGWSWKEDYDITRPQSWTPDLRAEWRLSGLEPLHPDRPVVHISWFEADAFARAHAGRLPTEAEWEKAATWDQEQLTARRHPWGDDPPIAGVHANLDALAGGPAAVGARHAGTSPYGCLGMIGDVWEWTASDFTGYPGFAPFPYREYSQAFFGPRYKVLRGGSWATRSRVAAATFRNWDYPQRRQIFSGVRIARDL
ncbi:MAG TPA: ergothioneine biosynthesis protein EgtB [Solirubrobacteraceae bacterium]|nr:ergothioneine biosynthesis protein EgtB [Solirubrobacteraceae bacterium]